MRLLSRDLQTKSFELDHKHTSDSSDRGERTATMSVSTHWKTNSLQANIEIATRNIRHMIQYSFITAES